LLPTAIETDALPEIVGAVLIVVPVVMPVVVPVVVPAASATLAF
jgi:hypothetical protein